MEIQGKEPDVNRVLAVIREGRFIWIEGIKEEIIPEESEEIIPEETELPAEEPDREAEGDAAP